MFGIQELFEGHVEELGHVFEKRVHNNSVHDVHENDGAVRSGVFGGHESRYFLSGSMSRWCYAIMTEMGGFASVKCSLKGCHK